MNLIYRLIIIAGAIILSFVSCNEEEYGPRKESTPVIESAGISPSTFTFGDSITLTASIHDPATQLSMLFYEVVSGDRVVTSGELPIGGAQYEVSKAIFVPLLNGQSDNDDIRVNIIVRNVLKGTTSTEITGLTGKRPVYPQLYLVTDNGGIASMSLQTTGNYQFQASDLTFDTSFRYKIAEKINNDNTIDYSGDVYGNVNGTIGMIDVNGESAFVYAPSADYIKTLTFDAYGFAITTTGSSLTSEDLALSFFTDQDINGESFRVLKRSLEKGKTYSVIGELAESRNLFNPDFFERTASNKVTFLGQTGEYTIYYNPIRRNTIVGVDNPSFPDYLLACGVGLGYPTYVTSAQIAMIYPGKDRTHSDWGFDHVLKYVLFRQINDGIYQGTFFTPSDKNQQASFKPFENTGWGNEKQAGNFTFTGEQIISGSNNWEILQGEDVPAVEPGYYKFTINLNNNTVHIDKVTL